MKYEAIMTTIKKHSSESLAKALAEAQRMIIQKCNKQKTNADNTGLGRFKMSYCFLLFALV